MAAFPSSEHEPLCIASRFGDYTVVPATSLQHALAAVSVNDRTWVVIDRRVLAHHREVISALVPPERVLSLEATEEAKSFEVLTEPITALLRSGFRRDCRLLAIGGGIIQDITAFLASILMRGVRWDFVPTTLLAQCDSCIGAKSSINIGAYKNQLGTFRPPERIALCTELLRTLPEEAIRSGMGEIVKFHLVEGEEAWRQIQAVPAIPTWPVLEQLIWRSLAIKRRYIEQDELDTGIRNLLNYGHTFGHAFESVSGFAIPHGIGVALGIAAATTLSARRGWIDSDHHAAVARVLAPIHHGFGGLLAGARTEALIAAMRTDKKNTRGACFVILTRGPGRMEKVPVDLEQEIAPALEEFTASLVH